MSELNLFNELCITVLDEREAAEPITMSCCRDLTFAERALYNIADDVTVSRVLKKLQAERKAIMGAIEEKA